MQQFFSLLSWCLFTARTQHDCHHDTKVKPEAVKCSHWAPDDGWETPETCWAVNKRQDNKLKNCCIWVVIYLNCTMMHGLTNFKFISMFYSDMFQPSKGHPQRVRLVDFQSDFLLIINELDALISQIYFGKKLYMFRTEELSETCRVSFQNKFEKSVHLVGNIIRNLSQCTVTWTSNLVTSLLLTSSITNKVLNFLQTHNSIQGCVQKNMCNTLTLTQLRQYLKLDTAGDCVQLLCNLITAGRKLWKLKANQDDMPDTTNLHSTDLLEVKESKTLRKT
jgi:hypothetical protein